MNKYLALSLTLIIATTVAGCSGSYKPEVETQGCTDEWYDSIDKKISTGDNQGHGPDVGSLEWRSVIEFKLGIRDDNNVPPLDSVQWCDYIHQNYIN